MRPLFLCYALGLLPAAWSSITVYYQEGQKPLTTGTGTTTSALPLDTAAAVYDPTTLTPPPVPNPAPPTTFFQQLFNAPVPGLSINQAGYFLGFSIEFSVIMTVIGSNSTRIQPPFLNLLSNVQARGGSVRIRIGGNSQDTATLVQSLADGKDMEKQKQVTQNPTDTPALLYTPDVLYMLSNISHLVNVDWYLGIPLNDTTDLRLAIAEYGESILGDRIIAFQVGNEPDQYANHGHRPQGYGPANYSNDFSTVDTALRADPKVAVVDHKLLGPSLSGVWQPAEMWAVDFIPDFQQSLQAVTMSFYPNNNCAFVFGGPNSTGVVDPQTVFASYLMHESGQAIAQSYIASTLLAQQYGLPFVMMETNSASCGGFPGVSDSFGIALWGLDYALQLAYSNFTNALLHVSGADVYYNPFTPPQTNESSILGWTVGPLYYSILAAAEVFGTSNKTQIVDLELNGNNTYTPGYAVYESGSLARLALFNYVSDPSGNSDYTMSFAIGGGTSGEANGTPGSVKVKYLVAPSVSDKAENITWAGQTFGGSFATDGRIQGTETIQTVTCNGDNTCDIKVPAPGFALVFLATTSGSAETYDNVETYSTSLLTKTLNTVTINPTSLALSNGQQGANFMEAKTSNGKAPNAGTRTRDGPSLLAAKWMTCAPSAPVQDATDKTPPGLGVTRCGSLPFLRSMRSGVSWTLPLALLFLEFVNVHAKITVYHQEPFMGTKTGTANIMQYTGAAAYDATTLSPPPVPESPLPTAFPVQLSYEVVPGVSIPQSGHFYGFSIEFSVISQVLGINGSFLQVPFLNLMSNLASRGGSVRVRIGGDTQETATLVESLPGDRMLMKGEPTSAGPLMMATPPLLYTREVLYMLANISSLVNIQWYLGIPLNDTQHLRLDIVSAAESILGDRLLGFQVGNMPDQFAEEGLRPPTYNVSDYFADFGLVDKALRANSTKYPSVNGKLIGPSISSHWKLENVWDTGFVDEYRASLGALSVEYYPLNNCAKFSNQSLSTTTTTTNPQDVFPTYLNHTSATHIVQRYLNSTALAQNYTLPFVMLETNTASCGGFAGLSDSFGAALWALDYGLQMAFGNFTGALMHVGGLSEYYNAFTPPPTNQSMFRSWTVSPVYYSALVAAEIFGRSNQSQILDLQMNNGSIYTPGYAVYDNGTLSRLALFNFVSDPSGMSDYTAAISVPASASLKQVQVKYLLAPSVSSLGNVTWAGQSFGANLTSDGRLSGPLDIRTIPCSQSTCKVPVPAPGFALVFLNASDTSAQLDSSVATFPTTARTKTLTALTVDPSVLATSNGGMGMQEVIGSTARGRKVPLVKPLDGKSGHKRKKWIGRTRSAASRVDYSRSFCVVALSVSLYMLL
ncbi:Glyco-hydro-79C domain-containing protein [Mycena chlorophos]|uniref:Glyco-hydro-79C domain-containing protein n=1 Tax=Mycena chlorophos TaxID=658473 RepID=A0A8H6SQE3_MYCCL|nr:Glyco-hydro-79C domain-containing protein [Mycena chlorophos]